MGVQFHIIKIPEKSRTLMYKYHFFRITENRQENSFDIEHKRYIKS